MVTDIDKYMLKLHKHYSKGVLLQSGGLLDQPNYYLEAMEIIG